MIATIAVAEETEYTFSKTEGGLQVTGVWHLIERVHYDSYIFERMGNWTMQAEITNTTSKPLSIYVQDIYKTSVQYIKNIPETMGYRYSEPMVLQPKATGSLMIQGGNIILVYPEGSNLCAGIMYPDPKELEWQKPVPKPVKSKYWYDSTTTRVVYFILLVVVLMILVIYLRRGTSFTKMKKDQLRKYIKKVDSILAAKLMELDDLKYTEVCKEEQSCKN